jgi:UDP-N-acetylmuramoyl-L-alanyl-D-glutamate--2,6-diaminopimelate ligase
MQTLNNILYKVNIRAVYGSTCIDIHDLQSDSRLVQNGTCFIAIKGTQADGHDFIQNAVNNGAVAVVCSKIPNQLIDHITYIEVENSALAAGIISHLFFGNPSEFMEVSGVTGTNGKTTIVTLLWKLFTSRGHTCGLISTIQNQIGDQVLESTHTTPDAISLHRLLSKMKDAGCTHVFMECSSHAIHQNRIAGIQFAAAVFSNITHDHLDYHHSFEEYIRVKKSWFDGLPPKAYAISNADDKRGIIMLQNCNARKYFYSLKTIADFKGKILENSLNGLQLIVNETEVHFKLIGEFNAYNLLAVFAVAICLGEDKHEVLLALSNLTGAEGRFDYQISKQAGVVGIVDYAHTPDALLNVLATIRKLRQGEEKIITVVGCGGNRDTAKRPIMAEVACQYSDKVILTSDNPRNEEPQEIIREMEAGVNVVSRKKCISIADRREAIKTAISLSNKKDIILVAGKGHEKYQEIKGVKFAFDDKKVMQEMFELLEK